MNSEQLLIEAKNIGKIYNPDTPEAVNAIRGVDLSIYRKEFINIVGVSGSGKSSLIHILGCMDQPTEGELFLGAIPVNSLMKDDLSEVRNKKLGFVFQDMYLLPNLTALDNVLLPLIPYGITQEDRTRAVELLKDVGLADRINFNPNELSGGQKQRVAICRALINNPEIIFADEPTGNLDTKRGNEILALLKDINEKYGTAIVVVTHDPNVEKFSDRTIEIEDGRIVSDRNKT